MHEVAAAALTLGHGDRLGAGHEQVVAQGAGKAQGGPRVGLVAGVVGRHAHVAQGAGHGGAHQSVGARVPNGSVPAGQTTANDHSKPSPWSTSRPPLGRRTTSSPAAARALRAAAESSWNLPSETAGGLQR